MSDVTIAPAEGGEAILPAAPAVPTTVENTPAPAKPEEGAQPASQPAGDVAPEPEKTPVKQPEGQPSTEVKPRKAGPIADLLQKKHDAETALETERAQWAKDKADMEAKLNQLSGQPAGPQTTEKIQALAEKHGLDATILNDIVEAARADGLPSDEIRTLLAERNMQKAREAEETAFDNRLERLQKALPNEALKANRERLMELAYSDKVAPDGEKYADKELSEIYFGYIKPEVEPGKPSGEAGATAGTRASNPAPDDADSAWNLSEAEFKKKQDEVRASG